MRYNWLSILKEGFNNNQGWEKTWKNPEIKKQYDVIIIGGGGHGLATAFYLAKEFNIKNVACLLYTSPSTRDRLKSRMPSSA